MVIKYDVKNYVATLFFERPEKLNALSSELVTKLQRKLEDLEKDRRIRVIVLTGLPKAFSTGADIKEMSQMNKTQAKTFTRKIHSLINYIEKMNKPVIAAINGYCLGGGNELAIACDLRVAGKSSKFGQPEVKIGIPPGAGASHRLPHLVGLAVAKDLIFTGRIIDSNEAFAIGLVNKVVPDKNVVKEAQKLAETIAANSPTGVYTSKKLINDQYRLKKFLEQEKKAFVKAFGTKEQKEGMKAFLEKRKPKF